jgi:hypothetical protein
MRDQLEGAKPPSAAGLPMSLPRLLEDNTPWPAGLCKMGCVQARFDSPPVLSVTVPADDHP